MKPEVAGYTLVETLTVLAIVLIISSALLANYNAGKSQRELKQAADGIVLALSRAQQYALGGTAIKRCSVTTTKDCSGSAICGGADGSCITASGYGVHLSNNATTYDFFADLQLSPHCTSPVTRACVTNYDCPSPQTCQNNAGFGSYSNGVNKDALLTNIFPAWPTGVSVELHNSAAGADSTCGINPTDAHITYQPPGPSATVIDEVGTHTCAVSCIFVKYTVGGTNTDTWLITVRRTTGVIELLHLTTPVNRACS